MSAGGRAALLAAIAGRIPSPVDRAALIAVDGPGGSGRTRSPEALSEAVRATGNTAHPAHIDDPHPLRAAPPTLASRASADP